ncbi:hypothetical protein DFH07DRAFT_947901 [Mycena maculata]|uniref:Uncharacterized protein n=1 Tax=Mycena maculata TaxID=230809 RepID=A0AAD7KHG5_9AGAR|nr:hypothetical protein DFH07DRAFT_947901 [Mycena maculata]
MAYSQRCHRHCAGWSNIAESDALMGFPYSGDASFELPLSSDTLFLISPGYATGYVNYLQSESISDSVRVTITAGFGLDKYLEISKVCLLKHKQDQAHTYKDSNTRLTRETEERARKNEKQRFEVTVTFPQTSANSSLVINNLSTDLQFFSQRFGDMSHVTFKHLSLKSVLGEISAESLSAVDAAVSTSMAPIEGTFNSSNSILLSTSNSPINVDVYLYNERD